MVVGLAVAKDVTVGGVPGTVKVNVADQGPVGGLAVPWCSRILNL